MNGTRAKSSFGTWTLAAILVAVLYLASFGPACWISQRAGMTGTVISAVYQPVLQVACRSPRAIATGVLTYGQWGLRPGQHAFFSKDYDTGYCRWEVVTRFGRIP